jgi:hypothetical protein
MYKDESKKFDIRVVEKYVQDGVVTPAEYAEYLSNLPDAVSNTDRNYELTFAPVRRRAGGRVRVPENNEEGFSPDEPGPLCSSEEEKTGDYD